MIIYQSESYSEVIDEISPLIVDHYHEICSHPEYLVLNPDFSMYEKLEDMGMLRVFTVRDDGQLIGYVITFVHPHLHYRDTIYGVNDVLFLAKPYRGGTVGYRMLKKSMVDLKNNCGVNVNCLHVKVGHPFNRLLVHLGCSHTEDNWEIIL